MPFESHEAYFVTLPADVRAIRCHEKAGFERVGLVDTPDGPALYMVRLRARGL
jgi:RimJ/RimL family protein N-acetyltransferase